MAELTCSYEQPSLDGQTSAALGRSYPLQCQGRTERAHQVTVPIIQNEVHIILCVPNTHVIM